MQRLVKARLIVANHLVGEGERPGGTAEILAHHITRCLVRLFKVEDEAWVSPAPLVDSLVVVAHHHIVALGFVGAGRGNQVEDQVLGAVHILELVHQHTVITLLQARKDGGVADQHLPAQAQLIVKGDESARLLHTLQQLGKGQIPGCLGGCAGLLRLPALAHSGRNGRQVGIEQIALAATQPGEKIGAVQVVEFAHIRGLEAARLGQSRQQDRIGCALGLLKGRALEEGQQPRVISSAHRPQSQRVQRHHRHPATTALAAQTCAHFLFDRGIIGRGQNAFRRKNPLLHQPHNALLQRCSFARARHGKDQGRAIGMVNDCLLLRGKPHGHLAF